VFDHFALDCKGWIYRRGDPGAGTLDESSALWNNPVYFYS